MTENNTKVTVSRKIEAPPEVIFAIVANPQRHSDIDGSDMLRGTASNGSPISGIGDTFTMKMQRLGREYLMINHVVEFEPSRRIFWEPAPGDTTTKATGGDPSKVGLAAGYRWGYILAPEGEAVTVVTAVFDGGPLSQLLLDDGGRWINGANTVMESMTASLERLVTACAKHQAPS